MVKVGKNSDNSPHGRVEDVSGAPNFLTFRLYYYRVRVSFSLSAFQSQIERRDVTCISASPKSWVRCCVKLQSENISLPKP